MEMKILGLFLLTLTVSVHGNGPPRSLAGFDPIQDVLSEKYEAGAYLIYDCEQKHWVCVLESYFEECKLKRQKELMNEEKLLHSCAPLGVLPTKKSCFQRQLFLTTHNHGQRFCIKDTWKKKAVSF